MSNRNLLNILLSEYIGSQGIRSIRSPRKAVGKKAEKWRGNKPYIKYLYYSSME
jgi:hypothetical protein